MKPWLIAVAALIGSSMTLHMIWTEPSSGYLHLGPKHKCQMPFHVHL